MVVDCGNLGHGEKRVRRIVVLFDEEETMAWPKFANRFAWPNALDESCAR